MFVPHLLIKAIEIDDTIAVRKLKDHYMNTVGYDYVEWKRLVAAAKQQVNSQTYKFVDLDAKVISKSAEEYSVGCEVTPEHNED